MKSLLKEYRFVLQFFGGSLLFYSFWLLVYENYLQPLGSFDWVLNRAIANQVAFYFSITGYTAKVVNFQIYPHLMYLDGEPIMSVDTPCNGLPMIYLFSSFIIIYSGPVLRKLAFVAFGIGVIHLLNLVRIIGLSYISIYSPDYFHFNHKYLFQIIVYSAIFSLWLFWILYGQNNNKPVKEGIKDFFALKFLPSFKQIKSQLSTQGNHA